VGVSIEMQQVGCQVMGNKNSITDCKSETSRLQIFAN
jgi:hypothetical protein